MKATKYGFDSITEHIASRFLLACCGNTHETFLAEYNEEVVVCCKYINGFKDFSDRVVIPKTDSLLWDKVVNGVIPALNRDDFWLMCLIDTILANADRHFGNYGENALGELVAIDNAECLMPLKATLIVDEDWMHNNTFEFPKCYRLESYQDMLKASRCPAPVIDKVKQLNVVAIMDSVTGGLIEKLRVFLRTVVYYRHSCLIQGRKFEWKGMRRFPSTNKLNLF